MIRLRSARESAALLLLMLLLLIACAGCGSSGPLHDLTYAGQPVLTNAGIPVVPGQPADFTAYAVNSASDPITLVSASLVALPGFPVAKLRYVAVDTTKDQDGAGRNWPPDVKVRPFAGAKLPRGQNNITFAISGPRLGVTYVAAGLRINYRYHGQDYSLIAWTAVEACVNTAKKINSNKADCNNAETNRIDNAVAKMAGIAS